MTKWSKWKVGEHKAGATIWYTVFRERELENCDNVSRQFSGGYYHTERIAQLLADELNKEDN